MHDHDFQKQLRDSIAGFEPTPPPYTQIARAYRRRQRMRGWIAVGGAVGAIGAVTAIVLVVPSGRSGPSVSSLASGPSAGDRSTSSSAAAHNRWLIDFPPAASRADSSTPPPPPPADTVVKDTAESVRDAHTLLLHLPSGWSVTDTAEVTSADGTHVTQANLSGPAGIMMHATWQQLTQPMPLFGRLSHTALADGTEVATHDADGVAQVIMVRSSGTMVNLIVQSAHVGVTAQAPLTMSALQALANAVVRP